MWNSIKNIIMPDSLSAAFRDSQKEGTALFSGGSYLTAQKNPSITSLIDINSLVDNGIAVENNSCVIGAGVTLQELCDFLLEKHVLDKLVTAIQYSCPSLQIRNQRTIGGEIGYGRTNSEVLVMLHAMDATLTVMREKETTLALREWDGKGIVSQLHIASDLTTDLLRFSLLTSAPAFVICAMCNTDRETDFAIGGRINHIHVMGNNNNLIESFPDFPNDHYGSSEYKTSLVKTAIQRMTKNK